MFGVGFYLAGFKTSGGCTFQKGAQVLLDKQACPEALGAPF